MTNTVGYLKERFSQPANEGANPAINSIRRDAFDKFSKWGIPTSKHEEWKYTRIARLFEKDFRVKPAFDLNKKEIDPYRLPGSAQANEIVFINGHFSKEHSVIRSAELNVLSLEEAAENEFRPIIVQHLGHSAQYLKDGVNALNMAFMQDGIFIHVKKGIIVQHPLYIYYITDARTENIFSQPRSLVHLAANSGMQIIESFITLGKSESFANQVMEVVVEEAANFNHTRIQDDTNLASQVCTTHIRQVGKSYVHSVSISLNGGMVRNNTNVIMEAAHCEAHMYGLYFQRGESHIDNHTIVDNVQPDCYSNELYKGILNDQSTGVFNGKIFVRPQAQKTNAYQSNKNILLSGNASVNTKPQLEIFADDVKCSHGCTVGQLDEEGLFYLQSRGIAADKARSLLLHGFVMDILDKIQMTTLREEVDRRISSRLELI